MILVEGDNDLASCVESYFGNRYDVRRVSALSDAVKELQAGEANILFAEIDPSSREQSSTVQELRRSHPNMTIVLTYLTPAAGTSWESHIRDSADVVVRKPYSVLKVDEAISRNGKRYKKPDDLASRGLF